jgi:AcrR family transcriptional regulator
MDLKSEGTATRRRGRELEHALLEAAWAQLLSGGYGSFTIDAVAQRAATSKPVIYRRWPSRETLVLAAVQHFFAQGTQPVPDTGTLRGDVIALLSQANESRLEMAAVISVQLGTYYQETGTTPADLRVQLLGDRASSMDTVLRRALDRGEVDAEGLTARMITLPFDLLRNEALMTLRPIPPETIVEIVDDIFLPLVSHRTRNSDRPRGRRANAHPAVRADGSGAFTPPKNSSTKSPPSSAADIDRPLNRHGSDAAPF